MEDFTGLKPGKEFLDLIEEAEKLIRNQPKDSILAVFDATDSQFNNENPETVKQFTQENTPYIKAASVVGIEGLLKIVLKSVSKFSGREFHLFNTREEAMEWLIAQ